MSLPPQPETPTRFWTNDRLTVVASLPCWDIVLSLYDGHEKTAAELARLTGRTPGALHAPLLRLVKSGIIDSKIGDDKEKDKKQHGKRHYC